MTTPAGFDVTPLELDRAALDFSEVAADIDLGLSELRTALDGLRAPEPPWGTDEPGTKFAERYVPVETNVLEAIASYVDQVLYGSNAISLAVRDYQIVNGNGAAAILGTQPGQVSPR